MRKVFNFSAGPAMLPEEVMKTAQAEFLDWNNTGMSMMELGHRGPEFQAVAAKAEADLRELMQIQENYHVLFLTGGATAQFAMVPLNLLSAKKKADFINTGIWSKKAYDEGCRYGEMHVAASTQVVDGLVTIPNQSEWKLQSDADYVHYTPNETIDGVEFQWIPETGDVPLIADMSSMILSQPVDVTKYGLIYAGAQKNMGQAGITIVIVRDDLVREPLFLTPTLYKYKLHVDNHSFYNTPPTFSWYMAGLVFDWLKKQGGVDAVYRINKRKADKLYSFIEQHHDFYYSTVDPQCRSIMNIVFCLRDENLNQHFLDESDASGLTNLRGHRIVGGMRASIYNAMPEEGVDALILFMRDFANRHG